MIVADISEWIWQNTFTNPAWLNVRSRVSPFRYRPRSKVAPRDSENTLWKYGSSLGNTTVDARVIATTRGTNASSRCAMGVRVTGTSDSTGGSLTKTTTLA